MRSPPSDGSNGRQRAICRPSRFNSFDAPLLEAAAQHIEEYIDPAVHVERRGQAEDASDLAGGQVVVESELQQQPVRGVEMRRCGCERLVELSDLRGQGRVGNRRRELSGSAA